MNRIARLARTAAISLVCMALTTGTSAAEGPSYEGGDCPQGLTCTRWCPGDPAIPGSQVLTWDWNTCHDWYWNSEGIVDVTTFTVYPWSGTPHQVAPPPPIAPAPAPSPPSTPFCSPRGSLIIIGPICDEIGVDLPAGSVR